PWCRPRSRASPRPCWCGPGSPTPASTSTAGSCCTSMATRCRPRSRRWPCRCCWWAGCCCCSPRCTSPAASAACTGCWPSTCWSRPRNTRKPGSAPRGAMPPCGRSGGARGPLARLRRLLRRRRLRGLRIRDLRCDEGPPARLSPLPPAPPAGGAGGAGAHHGVVLATVLGDRGAQVVRGAGLAEAGDVVELAFDGHQRRVRDLRRVHAFAGHVPQSPRQQVLLEHDADGVEVVLGRHVEH